MKEQQRLMQEQSFELFQSMMMQALTNTGHLSMLVQQGATTMVSQLTTNSGNNRGNKRTQNDKPGNDTLQQ